MAEKGWKMPDLARESGVSRPAISDIVNKKTNAKPETLQKIGKALGKALPSGVGPSRFAESGAVGYDGRGHSTERTADLAPEIGHQPSDEEAMEMLAYGRSDYVRFLANEKRDRSIRKSALLERHRLLVRTARQQGLVVDDRFAKAVEEIIQTGGI